MPIFRWGSALEAFRDLEREVDRWVRGIDIVFENPRFGRPFPSINLYEIGEEYLITAELPGTEAKDLDLSVANGLVTMKGTRDTLGEISEDRFRRSERLSGTWERTITVPERIDDDNIRAELTDGLLKLYLPKAPSVERKQIHVIGGKSEEEQSTESRSMEVQSEKEGTNDE
ncbi:Hsp20/alpha crystallin family protein [Thalassoglobus sp.]|uniref:Hsp20/alpha crystallin family protein n=1 Tax=Thalassoglobus sp. TaxID=2795869 RepID=UPI003AA93E8B